MYQNLMLPSNPASPVQFEIYELSNSKECRVADLWEDSEKGGRGF